MHRYVPTITKLSDQFGDYLLLVTCRRCNHSRTTEPHVFARMLGWDATLAALEKRLRCSKCHAKDCTLTPTNRPRPWGIPKNPH